MKIYFAQFYTLPSAEFPFSFAFNHWLSREFNDYLNNFDLNIKEKNVNCDLIIRISAKKQLSEPEIRGPILFKKDKQVEYFVYLPCDEVDYCNLNNSVIVVRQLVHSTASILERYGMNSKKICSDLDYLYEEFLNLQELVNKQ